MNHISIYKYKFYIHLYKYLHIYKYIYIPITEIAASKAFLVELIIWLIRLKCNISSLEFVFACPTVTVAQLSPWKPLRYNDISIPIKSPNICNKVYITSKFILKMWKYTHIHFIYKS